MSVAYKRPTVLVIDDEPFNLSLLDEVLNKNYTIQKASNGPEALSLPSPIRPI